VITREVVMSGKMRVINPLGKAIVKKGEKAARLDTLDGKTVCEIWNGMFKGDILFPIINRMLKERYPGVKIIPYSDFTEPSLSSMAQERQKETLEAIQREVLNKNCDAIITGTGA
jgi:hypothetical protein